MKNNFLHLCSLLAGALSMAAISGNAQTAITVNTASAQQRAISPYVYGLNPYHYNSTLTGMAVHASGIGVTSLRFGGDAVSTYNWENNTNISWNSNCGATYATNDNNRFLAYASGQPTSAYNDKAGAALKMYADAASLNAYPLLQLTAMQYVSKDAAGCLGAACSQGTSSGRMARVFTEKPGALSLNPDPIDTVVYADEELNYLRAQPSAPTGPRGYCLENEPGIWKDTHPCAHPTRTTCGEVLTKNISLAKRIRALDPGGEIFGPGMYGFTEFTQLNYTNNAPSPTDWANYNMNGVAGYNPVLYNYMTWVCSYLREMKQAGAAQGLRLLDGLDIHYYSDGEPAVVQASRSLWDSSYVENSWITRDVINNASLKLIPCLQKAIADWYPGTKLAITEWGLLDNSNPASAIYTADALGAMGRYGVYMANYFGELQGYTAGAFKIFRNYDGSNSAFPETSVQTRSADNSKISAYAAIRGNNDSTLHLILLNRSATTETASITLNSTTAYQTVQAFVMSGSGGGGIAPMSTPPAISGSNLSLALSGRSVYHLVLRSVSTGVGEQSVQEARLLVHPNPAHDVLYVSCDPQHPQPIRLVDMFGRMIQTQEPVSGMATQSIDISGLAVGTYIIVSGNQRAVFQKIVAR